MAVYLRMESQYYLIEDYLPLPPESMRTFALRVTLILIRYMILLGMGFEASRVNVLSTAIFLTHQNVCINAVLNVQKKNPWMNGGTALRKYTELRVLLRNGCWFIHPLIAIYMATGFLLSVLANCFNFLGWRFFSWQVYLPLAPFSVVLQLLVAKGVSLTAEIHKVSYGMIKRKWVLDTAIVVKREGKFTPFKKYKRVLASQMPIGFCSGSMALMDKETKRNYVVYIMETTTDLFLLFDRNITSMIQKRKTILLV